MKRTLAPLLTAWLLASCGGDSKAPRRVADGADPPNTPCEGSRVCRVWGWCEDRAGQCVAGTDQHCRDSESCKKGGLCSLDGQKCVAKGDDCDASEWCKESDLCTAREGVCK